MIGGEFDGGKGFCGENGIRVQEAVTLLFYLTPILLPETPAKSFKFTEFCLTSRDRYDVRS